MVKNKKGWIRIMEATIAVLLITSILIIVATRQEGNTRNTNEYIYLIQRETIKEISINKTMRNLILNSEGTTPTEIEEYIEEKIPTNIKAKIKICEADINIQPSCKMEETDFTTQQEFYDTLEKEVYVEETIISSNLNKYKPKKVRMFIWEETQ